MHQPLLPRRSVPRRNAESPPSVRRRGQSESSDQVLAWQEHRRPQDRWSSQDRWVNQHKQGSQDLRNSGASYDSKNPVLIMRFSCCGSLFSHVMASVFGHYASRLEILPSVMAIQYSITAVKWHIFGVLEHRFWALQHSFWAFRHRFCALLYHYQYWRFCH